MGYNIMEEIIKNIMICEYDQVAMLILLDNLEQNDLEKILYIFVYKLIDKKIDENVFMNIMKYIFKTKIKFNLINNIKQITDLLNDENYDKSYELLTIACDMETIYNDIQNFITIIFKSEGKIKRNIDINTFDHNKIYDMLYDAKIYIKSFEKLASYSNNVDGCEFYCREEILNRLILLKKYFGIYFMSIIGIKIITLDDFLAMKYNDIIEYYFDCVKLIKRILYNHIKILKNYKRLVRYYDNIVNNIDNSDNINKFENISESR